MKPKSENKFAVSALQITTLLSLLSLAACFPQDNIVPPAPQELTQDATGYYCQMTVADHPGPKAQIFKKNNDRPVWFPSVRDAFAYLMLPGEAKTVSAIYVSEVQINEEGKVMNWENPVHARWIDGKKAIYVIESRKKGGMDLNEVVPFSDTSSAIKFIKMYSGRIVSFGDVSVEYIFAEASQREYPDTAEKGRLSAEREAEIQ